ncbi:DMT family transporter [Alysiella crassa]|uniref:Predicted permease, DMT superfamily n=1 Tax=Alysiella crassa TaxID=153491 RepID=A0A376BVL4_9NEIS|nr:DMT family transporter [Alysiella crassa]UOP06454.1 DMT family transporter [Alysiella crassa]SSY80986.1 Predicted permease, DMT superfamily [Alysiella crassa]
MNTEAQKKFAPIGLTIGCIVFGLGSVIVAHLPIGAYAIAFWRLAVAAVIFAFLARWFAQKFPENTHAKRYAWWAGAFLGLDLALWHESIYAVGPGISTVLNCLQIFWLTMIGVIWFKEKLSKLQIFSLIMALTGIVLIGSPEFGHNQNAMWGFVSGILSGLMLSLSMVFVRKTQQAAPTPIFPLMFRISLGGMAILILPTLLLNDNNMLPTTWSQIGWILVYGAVMQCFAWGMIAYSIPLLSLSLSGLLLLTEPVAALMIDFAFLDKEINGLQWFGAVLTMVAIYLGSLKSKNTH